MTWRVDPDSGWLEGARRVPSPNFDERPAGVDISLLVIHGISLPPNEFGGDGIDRFFTNQLDPDEHPYFREIHQLRVSAHLLIRRNGEVVQYVPFTKRAWHAGESCYQERTCCNDFSIGIELEGADDIPYEPKQYEVLQSLIQLLRDCYPTISSGDIVGHCHIAPQRKTDPGPAFEWARLGINEPKA